MKIYWIIAIVITFLCLFYLKVEGDKSYQACVQKGEHTNERCYELAYL